MSEDEVLKLHITAYKPLPALETEVIPRAALRYEEPTVLSVRTAGSSSSLLPWLSQTRASGTQQNFLSGAVVAGALVENADVLYFRTPQSLKLNKGP